MLYPSASLIKQLFFLPFLRSSSALFLCPSVLLLLYHSALLLLFSIFTPFICCSVSPSCNISVHRLQHIAVHSFIYCCRPSSTSSSATTFFRSSISRPIVPPPLYVAISPIFRSSIPSSLRFFICSFLLLIAQENIFHLKRKKHYSIA